LIGLGGSPALFENLIFLRPVLISIPVLTFHYNMPATIHRNLPEICPELSRLFRQEPSIL